MNEVQKYHEHHAGRGPTGKLRNFGAMSDGKMKAVYSAVVAEQNDAEAYNTIVRHLLARNLWCGGVRVAPPGIEQDIWDTLGVLAV